MGSSESILTANELLLGYTRKKLKDVVETIKLLKEEDFPHEDSSHALGLLEAKFKQRLELLDKTSANNDTAVVSRVCKEATETIDQFLPLLGFIARSTHIRNAFELHGPVLKLVHKALGPDAKLILSSEWEFSPFTYVLPSLEDRRYVMIGLPASESSNALIIPLAGHELGHSIWANQKLDEKYKEKLVDVLVGVFTGKHHKALEAFFEFDTSVPESVTTMRPWQLSYGWAVRQCEEIFCDLVGLMTFGRSYLHAFAYLLAPGPTNERKAALYPTEFDRVDILLKAGKQLGIPLPSDIHLQFEQMAGDQGAEVNWTEYNKLMLRVTDEACQQLVKDLMEDARTFCVSNKLDSGTDREVDRIATAFGKLVPASQVKNLADIINAGWKICMEYRGKTSPTPYGELTNERPEMAEVVLNDLILKTVEVFDIQERQTKS